MKTITDKDRLKKVTKYVEEVLAYKEPTMGGMAGYAMGMVYTGEQRIAKEIKKILEKDC